MFRVLARRNGQKKATACTVAEIRRSKTSRGNSCSSTGRNGRHGRATTANMRVWCRALNQPDTEIPLTRKSSFHRFEKTRHILPATKPEDVASACYVRTGTGRPARSIRAGSVRRATTRESPAATVQTAIGAQDLHIAFRPRASKTASPKATAPCYPP